MNLRDYDNKCVRVRTKTGEVYEGVADYCNKERVYHEYGIKEEALLLLPLLLFKSHIESVESLEEVHGPFGHYSEKYGLLEEDCLASGTDIIEEVLESEDDEQVLRMLSCLEENCLSLVERALPGKAPWRSGNDAPESKEDEEEPGAIYREDLEIMLDALIKYSTNTEIAEKAEKLLKQLRELLTVPH